MSNETLHGQQLFIFAIKANRAAFFAHAKKLARLQHIKDRARKLREERPC
jgi:hypothetical protein